MDELIIFVKLLYQKKLCLVSHQRDLCLASIKHIKPFNGKVGQSDLTKTSGRRDTPIALWNLAITTKCENIG